MAEFKRAYLSPDQSLAEALKNMNATGFRAALVVDAHETLLGLLTDGDIRKGLLRGISLESQVHEVMNPNPLVGPPGLSREEYISILMRHGNDCLPVVDSESRVLDFVLSRDIFQDLDLQHSMVIMAGGAGKRLWPLTKDLPKPLLPVANRPLLGHILSHAQQQGFRNVWVSTHYKSDQIEAYLQANTPDGLSTNLIKESSPMGTAGCLKGLQQQADDKPFFLMNGDILSKLDFRAMLDWHTQHGNLLTLACHQFGFQVPYGVLETQGQALVELTEKPVKYFNVNAGIYLVERKALAYIPDDVYFDMTDLINALLEAGLPVGVFPLSEAWVDIGKHEDYERVNRDSQALLQGAAQAASPGPGKQAKNALADPNESR